MPAPPWDRLLETFCKRDATSLLLIPGSPPMFLIADHWRTCQIPPVTTEEVATMATKLIPSNPTCVEDGYAAHDFWYGKEAFFHLKAFGHPNATALLVARWPRSDPENPAPQSPRDRLNW